MSFKARFRDIPQSVPPIDNVVEKQVEHNISDIEHKMLFELSEKIMSVPVWFEYTEDEKFAIVNSFIDSYAVENMMNISIDEKECFSRKLLACLYGFGSVDVLLSNEEIFSVYIKDKDIYYIDKTGNTIKCESLSVNIEKLCTRILLASAVISSDSVLKFSYKNLLITIVRPPAGQYYLLIRKKSREKTDFAYLLENNKIDESIYAFFEYLLNSQKNILLSGVLDCGKTSYINSFLEFVNNTVLFQNTKILDVPSYLCEALSESEFENLINAISFSKPDYIYFDLNRGYSFNYSDGGIVSTIRAESVFDAVTKISADEMCHRKITEKQAKANIAKSFDYIVHLGSDLMIESVSELSLNKAGSLVLNEVLKYDEGHYSYDFSGLDIQNNARNAEVPGKDESFIQLDGSFKSRFV